jgi:mono/diheme cytochrome c family protein
MKKLLLIPFLAFLGVLFIQGTSVSEAEPETITYTHAALPDDVKAVVDKKCYGCHNANSKNEKGKAKLDWDTLDKMKKSKRMAAMGEIAEVLEKGEMPPKKFLENKPEAALSETELATLVAWSAGKKKKSK